VCLLYGAEWIAIVTHISRIKYSQNNKKAFHFLKFYQLNSQPQPKNLHQNEHPSKIDDLYALHYLSFYLLLKGYEKRRN
jgi:hypothetical protein